MSNDSLAYFDRLLTEPLGKIPCPTCGARRWWIGARFDDTDGFTHESGGGERRFGCWECDSEWVIE